MPPFAEKIEIFGIRNVGKVNNRLYRGAQPSVQGEMSLRDLGFTTIVDLREENADQVTIKRKVMEQLGMDFVYIPIGGFDNPTRIQTHQFVALVVNPKNKIFVHCKHGEDRTGVMIALYRMAVEKWSPEDAAQEMDYFGFHNFWHPGMKRFVLNYFENKA